jgi:protein AroM
MGYSADMHETVRNAIDAPVLLSRRLVAGVVRQML